MRRLLCKAAHGSGKIGVLDSLGKRLGEACVVLVALFPALHAAFDLIYMLRVPVGIFHIQNFANCEHGRREREL